MNSWFDQMKAPPVHPGEPYPLFNRMSIETSSFCNRSCSFCPIHRHPRKQTLMTDVLYTKICNELADLKFAGCIELFLLNEPLYDPKYLERIRELREACPKCNIYVSTNGDAILKSKSITLDELKEAGLSVICFAIYDDAGAKDWWNEAHALMQEYIKYEGFEYTDNRYRRHPRKNLYINITDMRSVRAPTRLVTVQITNRGRDVFETRQDWCPRPMRHLVVEHDGNIPICCAVDPTDKQLPSMGNATTQTLIQIWNGPAFHNYRLHLQDKRRDLPGCSTCNARVAYPHVFTRVTE